jgi:hypothetical protein
MAELTQQRLPVGNRTFRRCRRRRRAQIGDKIGDGEIGFVPDRRDHRNAAGVDRPRHSFFIKRPYIL